MQAHAFRRWVVDTPSIAKKVVDSMGNRDSQGDNTEKAPKGVTLGHVTAMERFKEAHSEGKASHMAAAMRDFVKLVHAEGDEGE